MKQREVTELTDEELLAEAKKIKTTKIFDSAFIGFLTGVAIYSTIKKGFGLLTFLPLLYVPIAIKNTARNKALAALLKERNLK